MYYLLMAHDQNLVKISSRTNHNKPFGITSTTAPQKRTSILSPLSDFWTLGGLSILLCLILHVASFFKDDLPLLQMRFMQVTAVFSVLSIICNHPHFMISYRFGYGRGIHFIFKNWFSLIVVPVGLIALYAFAYFKFDTNISQSTFILKMNSMLEYAGLSFRFGKSEKLGEEIMSLSIWFMYLTVGWHYCKQVYGCMMVYAFYDGYKLKAWHRSLFKWSLISVAIYQSAYMSRSLEKYSSGGVIQDQSFQGFTIAAIGVPDWIYEWSIFIMAALAISGIAILILNYIESKQLPSWNFLVPWVAFYIWWVPMSNLPEYYILMIPFFHSLQYLPFALRVENEKIKKDRWYNTQVSLRIMLLLAVSLLSFEFIPAILDKNLETNVYQSTWFFTSVFAIFLNIHHFFIDSVAWRLKDKEIGDSLLYK